MWGNFDVQCDICQRFASYSDCTGLLYRSLLSATCKPNDWLFYKKKNKSACKSHEGLLPKRKGEHRESETRQTHCQSRVFLDRGVNGGRSLSKRGNGLKRKTWKSKRN